MDTAMPLPKYHQIYLVLREQLQEGRYDVDGVPGEHALAAQFRVARITIRKAMEMLVADGLVSRRPGLGTWPRSAPAASAAAPRPRAAQKAQLTGLMENIVNMGLRTAVRVLDCVQVGAPPAVAEALEIAPGEPVIKSLRVRSTEAGPLSYITTYVPLAVAAFTREDLERQPLLMLLESAGVEFGGATQTISARLADAQVAPHLDVAVGSALLAVTRLVRDVKERPVQLLQGLYRPDRYQYQLQLSRVGGIDAKVWVSEELSAQFH
ncbi:GntR family transcriptional regulator [Achromobacter sp. Marseille-Q0513]|uniref:GntR family transcriptional regulator n=1 Tax=Achromobacter sp. Marseille-Q0513 TaxID=2829161 RepID=UPI001B9E4EF6|nr:GntR family transcriptional regulator [Achromobacter sp. Marseille-Q0513]MBR8656351.1 GntR family transcriptional regulator [Achromobacter sp. Marseille-Q0513]